MTKLTTSALLCGVVLVCLASCSESRRANRCDDVLAPCTEIGEMRCSSDARAIEACGTDADGCLLWVVAESCGAGMCEEVAGSAPVCDGSGCDDECSSDDADRCSGRTIESCETGADGCLDWTLAEDCSAADQGCSEASGEAECVEGCGDECEPHDGDRCNGTRVEHCGADSEGCWLWDEVEDCADAGEECSDSGDVVECVTSCDDACAAAGESQCDGQVIQNCETGADGCLDWVDGRDCEADSLFCDDSSGTAECSDSCSDECGAVGVTQCDGDTVQNCELGAGDCLYWVDGEECAAAGLTCEESSTGAACVGACSDDCPAADATRCLGNLVQTCELGSAGCLDWADTTDCEADGDVCVVAAGDAMCLCIDECSLGDSQCVGDVVQTCEDIAGCLQWVDRADCSTLGLPCDDTSGTAECVTGDGDDCASAMAVWSFPFVLDGSDFGGAFDDDQTFSHASCLSRPGEPEAIFAVTVDAGATIIINEFGDIDVTASVQTTCDPAGACEVSLDSWDPSGGLLYDVPAAGTYYIIIEESFRGGDPYDILIDVLNPEDCSDGLDNDRDGDIDCADADCFGDPTSCATETLCADGADNDADGDTDCDDADCTGVPECAPQQGIYEIFGGSTDPVDLTGSSILFTPDASATDGYTWTTSTATGFVVAPGTGTTSTPLTLGDDASEAYAFTTMTGFDFYGATYTSMFVSSNGYITFDSGSSDYTPSRADLFAQPVISALWTDLNPPAGGTITVDDSATQIVVTFDDVPRYGSGAGLNSFQIILNSDGSIELVILAFGSRGSPTATGITDGLGSAAYPPETDFVTVPPEADCADGVDNDFDGDTDCDDSDCATDPGCYESDCSDGVDNDGDGDTDCWDDECIGDPDCAAHGYWEDYPRGTPDIEGDTVTFTPDAADPVGYSWTSTPLVGMAYPVAPGTGTTSTALTLGDDDNVEYTLAHMTDFTFFSVDHTSFFVGSNGYITFGSGSDSFSSSAAAHFEFPCISAIRTDLDPRARGTVTVDEFADRAVITFDDILPFGGGGSVASNEVQIILNSDGSIELHYLNISGSGILAGISSGVGDGAFPPETNFVP